MFTSKKAISALIILSILLGSCLGKKGKLREMDTTPAGLYEKGLALYKKRRYGKAREVFNEVKGSFPGVDPYYTWAELKVADCYFFEKEYAEAIANYEEFKKFHPFHEDIPYVIFQIGLAHFKQIRATDRDQTATRKALSNFEFLMANYPPSVFTEKAREKANICREKLAEKELYIAKFYYKKKKYQGAKARLEAAVKLYPEVDIVDEVLFYLGRSYLKLGERDAARRVFRELVQNHPDSTFSNKARKALSEILDEGPEGGEG
ncbi:MAG: outer membrane protein assembly factor BamD [Deltaproteobacteria bacterium]|nr:outer membrane protein assembly factor BamD [Deltaproteobacteria bacterium]